MIPPVMPANVAAVFTSYPPAIATRLREVRDLIFDTALLDGVGPLEETLKWGEPAYLTSARTGSTIRLGLVCGDPDRCAVLFNCNTTLVESFRMLFSDDLRLSGNRAILLDVGGALPREPLAACISMALTYRRLKRSGAVSGLDEKWHQQ